VYGTSESACRASDQDQLESPGGAAVSVGHSLERDVG